MALTGRALEDFEDPIIDYEIARINISILDSTKNWSRGSLVAFIWHRDSYAFICVFMLSNYTGMTGGETVLKTTSKEVIEVRESTW